MSKTESRDFWVPTLDVELLKTLDRDYLLRLGTGKEVFSPHRRPESIKDLKITISWQVPDRVVTISESEFDKIFWIGYYTKDFIKEKLFGEKG